MSTSYSSAELSLSLLSRRTGRTMEEIRAMIEREWFPAEVLWTSKSTITISTAFPSDVAESRLVLRKENVVHPEVHFNQVNFKSIPIPDCPIELKPDVRVMFRFKDKRDELLAKTSRPLSKELVVNFAHETEWSCQSLYEAARRRADACPEYRFVTRREVKVADVPDPKERRWVAKYQTVETEHWKGFDLADLTRFFHWHTRVFTRYDNPAYQRRLNGGGWVDCPCPLV